MSTPWQPECRHREHRPTFVLGFPEGELGGAEVKPSGICSLPYATCCMLMLSYAYIVLTQTSKVLTESRGF